MGRVNSLGCRLRTFLPDGRGVAAVEFAFVVPVLIALLLGGSELSVALTVNRKVQAMAGTVSDLASQSQTLSEADFKGLFSVAKATMAPYASAPLQNRLTQIWIDNTGKGFVDWSCQTTGYAALAKGTSVEVPVRYAAARNLYLIRGESRYDYSAAGGQFINKTVTFSGLNYSEPRYSTRVDTAGCATFGL